MSGSTDGANPANSSPAGAQDNYSTKSGSPLRVLLVEGSSHDAQFVGSLFEGIATQKYDVTWVETFESAQQQLSHSCFDVCLLDFQLKDRTGLDLLNVMPRNERIPFLFLTSTEEHDIDVVLGQAGASDYLVKSHLNAPLLERAIRYALERKSAERELHEAQQCTQATLDALKQAHRDLEMRVLDRTAALTEANRILAAEIAERESAERGLRTRMRQQEVVAELGRRALTDGTRTTLFGSAVQLIAETLGVEVAWFAEKLPHVDVLQPRAEVGFGNISHRSQHLRQGLDSQSGYTLLCGEPVISEQVNADDRFTPSQELRDTGVTSSVTVSVTANESPLGVLGAGSRIQRRFDQNDVHFLQAVANLLGAAIARSRVEEEVRQLNDELKFSNDQLREEIAERQMAVAAMRKFAEELEFAKQQAETANRAKSEFLSRMSHELRTPLNSILGFGQILNMQQLTEEQHGDVGHILRAGRHLLELINEVLDIARIEAGRTTFSPESIQVNRIVTECVDLVRPLATMRQIRLENEVPPDEDIHVLADRQRLKQVLLNLLSNAIKYNCEAGTVAVRVAPARGTAESVSNSLCLEIVDTGAGLTAAEMEKLFVPFERLDADGTGIEGTGIGLALCKRLIEAMGGQVGVNSVVGTGSTFWVQLPQTGPPQLLLPSQISEIPALRVRPSGSVKTILYIEDNLANLTVVNRALSAERASYKLLSAMQANLGLEMAREYRPDLILLDIHLPDIEGDVVLKRLRADSVTFKIPIVILSADATPGQKERLLDAGASAFLSKPLDLLLFFQTLDDLLGESPRS